MSKKQEYHDRQSSSLKLDREQPIKLQVALEWPGCGNGSIFDRATKSYKPLLCKRRSCPVCRRFMAKRLAKQILQEGPELKRVTIPEAEWPALRKKLNRVGKGYKSIPQPGDTLVIITKTDKGEALPADEGDLIDAIEQLLEDAPDGKRVSGSRGFGGKWTGAHAKNQGRYRRFNAPYSEVKKAQRELGANYQQTGTALTSAVDHAGLDEAVSLAVLGDQAEGFMKEVEDKA